MTIAVSPKITVYIACHNHRRFIVDCIESVLSQSMSDWELLIIDDRSIDGSDELVARYAGDPRVRLFRTEGVGLPRVCNLALKEANGDYIIRLDGDDMFDENCLLVLANYLDKHSEHALVFPDYYLIDEFGNITSHEWRTKMHHQNHVLDIPPHGACTMIRKSVLMELGGYRVDLGAQDGLDLWVRLKDRRLTGNVNVPLFYYRRHGENLTGNPHRIADARRRIKLDSVAQILSSRRPITAIIPCRRNYDFVVDLWAQQIEGASLLKRAIHECLQSELVEQVIVACDNPEAQVEAMPLDDERVRFFPREPASTTRTHSLVPVLRQIVDSIDPERRGISVVHYVGAPFITAATIDEALSTLLSNRADVSFPVEEMRHVVYRRDAYGLTPLTRRNGPMTDLGTLYREAPTCLAFCNANLDNGTMLGPRQVSFVSLPYESFFVDSPLNLDMARFLAHRRSQASATPFAVRSA
jgi:glycosyltransferase involved in cell wall biosynthesis